MKFAKTLQNLMVPEWQTQYVDYKLGKKKIKATTNRLRNASTSPALNALRRASRIQGTLDNIKDEFPTLTRPRRLSSVRLSSVLRRRSFDTQERPRAEAPLERSPLQPSQDINKTREPDSGLSYGSFDNSTVPTKPPSLLLPDPIQPFTADTEWNGEISTIPPISRGTGDAQLVRPKSDTDFSSTVTPSIRTERPFIRRVLTLGRTPTRTAAESSFTTAEVQSKAEKEFLRWLLEELKKCEQFYSCREKETLGRYDEMYEQLDIMRELWVRTKHHIAFEQDDTEDMADGESSIWALGSEHGPLDNHAKRRPTGKSDTDAVSGLARMDAHTHAGALKPDGMEDSSFSDTARDYERGHPSRNPLNSPAHRVAKRKLKKARPHAHTPAEALKPDGREDSGFPESARDRDYERFFEPARDYERRRPCRKPLNSPAHRVAKRKLKKAYIEYYHGLEMLKSYITLNRECFRKITKKFDKASGLRTSHRFMTEYVDKSYFGGPNNKLDDLMNDTEALFARFFERGSRKEASQRLRSRENKTMHHTSVLRSGVYLGSSAVIGIYAVYRANERLDNNRDPEMAIRTGYLLQVWGGCALMLLQTLLFAVNLRVWAKNRINYAFIFEFDTRHMLNYREFLEIPAVLCLLFTVCFWLSVHDFWSSVPNMIHFPIVFVALSAAFLFNPFKVMFYHSRRWFLRLLFRLVFSGAFPVEFKDFWIGDMFCSLTYAVGNIELFFCLYARDWNGPEMCNSSHSRVMGFLTALPGLWRSLQCFRRYYNSKMWFPHLVNGGKYAFTILHYMTLSIWRIDPTHQSAKAAFIVCASINSIYCTIWDIVMDWSLLDPYAKYPLLRDTLGFKTIWPYYLAMFINPIIRCNWFLYFVFGSRIQHSAVLCFLISVAEVLRRFMWCFFRMENEHIGNVGANRAYRHLPLPYHFSTRPSPPTPIPEADETAEDLHRPAASTSVEPDLERMDTLRRRSTRTVPPSPVIRTIARVGRSMTQAHLQDYERRRVPDEATDDTSDEEEDGDDYYERTAEATMGTPHLAKGAGTK